MKIEHLSWLGGAWLHEHGVRVAVAFLCVGLVWLLLDLFLSIKTGRRGQAVGLLLPILLFLAWRIWFTQLTPGGFVLMGAAFVAMLLHWSRAPWYRPRRAVKQRRLHLAALGILLLSTGVKCVELDRWPPNVSAYAAMTAMDAVRVMEEGLPEDLWSAGANDLQSGGTSPLHLPFLLGLYHTAGPNAWSMRMAEVLGSLAALVFFWLLLARVIPGWWGVIALGLFAFSPQHLSQSRMGVFLSISLAVGMALLWLVQRCAGLSSARWYHWAALGLAAGLVNYGYAPMRIMALLFCVALLVHPCRFWRAPRRWVGPALAVLVWGCLLAVQMQGEHGLFRTSMGSLATDAPIWRKTAEDHVTTQRQPMPVILDNLGRNAAVLLNEVLRERRVPGLHAFGFVFGVALSLVALLRRRAWVLPLFFLLGVMPALLIFPVLRRMFLVEPLLMAAAVVYLGALVAAVQGLVRHAWWTWTTRVVVGLGIACMALHGLHLFAAENGNVGTAPVFGPIFQAEMIDEIALLLPTHKVYVLNARQQEFGYRIGLYEQARRLGEPSRLSFVYLYPNQGNLDGYLRSELPVCFAWLEEDHRRHIEPLLRQALPQGRLERRYRQPGNHVMYSFYFVNEAGE